MSKDFSYQSFSITIDKARKASNSYGYDCCIPGCNERALKHSHIVPQSVLKKHICNNKHELIQCQIDEIHPMSVTSTGELPLEKFAKLGIEYAMSMPIFCGKHDNSLFEEYEQDADSIKPQEAKFQVLQSLRAVGALRHREERILVQNSTRAAIDDLFAGSVFVEERKCYEYLIRRYDATISDLYSAVVNNDFSNYSFTCVEIEPLKVAICDALIDEEDIEQYCMSDNYSNPCKALYIHLLPKGDSSYVVLGYDKRYIPENLKIQADKWLKELQTDTIRTVYDILCHCSNNWCISPDCDEKILDGLKKYYSVNRMEAIL